MNMKDKVKQIAALSDELIAELNTMKVELVSSVDYDNSEEHVYEMPQASIVSKHGFFVRYVILRIDNGTMKCGGLGDADDGKIISLNISDLQLSELVELAQAV